VIELFVFLQMGGKHVEMVELSEGRTELTSFDAHQCECAVPSDKERMLAFIEAACGTMDEFNAQVRAMLGMHCTTCPGTRALLMPHRSSSAYALKASMSSPSGHQSLT